jgi:hypothetical protein
MQADQIKDQRLIEQIQVRMQARVRILEAAQLIESVVGRRSRGQTKKIRKNVATSPSQPPTRRETTLPDAARKTWASELTKILGKMTDGMSHQELLATAAKAGLPRSTGDKGFYNAVWRLMKAGQIVKSGGLLYSEQLATELQRRGQPLPIRVAGRGGAGSIVLGILNEHPQGLSGPEIKELAGKHPDSPRSMREHDQYIYNVLGSLREAGAVLRLENGKYRLATPHAGSGTH